MEDISQLIKEAKPLYFARKKRRRQIKTSLAVLTVVLGLGWFYPRSAEIYYDLDSEVYQTVNGSVIEDMGLPVDDFGLLMVS